MIQIPDDELPDLSDATPDRRGVFASGPLGRLARRVYRPLAGAAALLFGLADESAAAAARREMVARLHEQREEFRERLHGLTVENRRLRAEAEAAQLEMKAMSAMLDRQIQRIEAEATAYAAAKGPAAGRFDD